MAKAIASVFCSLDEAFAETRTPSGTQNCKTQLTTNLLLCVLGTTISLTLICGSLLTVANVGDSEVFMDTGQDIVPMTECHKVDTSPTEQTR